jgi:hypothetical protein
MVLSVTVAAFVPSLTATGQDCDPVERIKLLAHDGAHDDAFGDSVAMSGDRAVIGAFTESGGFSTFFAGAAYVYYYNGTTMVEEAKLIASDRDFGDTFGDSVAISGQTIVAGAPGNIDSGHDGTAYVFQYDGTQWVEQTILVPPTSSKQAFGFSVGVSGDRVIVGADLDSENGSFAGAAYVYQYDGAQWILQQKLLASDGASEDAFGYAVAISGDTVVVGAHSDDDLGEDAGSVYVFQFDGAQWVEQAKLHASDSAPFDTFGHAVAISDDTIVVGAMFNDDLGDRSGSAYAYRFDGSQWVEQAKLLPSDGAAFDYFGDSVSVSGGNAVIGADKNGFGVGAAYLFHFDGTQWTEQGKMVSSDGISDDHFGYSVSVSGDAAVIGAYAQENVKGAAYLFELNCQCPADFNGDGEVNSQDFVAFLNAFVAGEPEADFNGDGEINSQDFVAFLNAFVAGC